MVWPSGTKWRRLTAVLWWWWFLSENRKAHHGPLPSEPLISVQEHIGVCHPSVEMDVLMAFTWWAKPGSPELSSLPESFLWKVPCFSGENSWFLCALMAWSCFSWNTQRTPSSILFLFIRRDLNCGLATTTFGRSGWDIKQASFS